MNVNSIKINNVYHNGEVDLDVLLPEAVEGLDVIKGLDENKEVLGAKNLLPLTLENLKAINTVGTWSGNVYTVNELTFTVNTDSLGSVTDITVNGTNNSGSNMFFRLTNKFIFESNKHYIFNGCTGGSNNTYFMYNTAFENEQYFQCDDEIILHSETLTSGYFYIGIRRNIILTNQVFLPMIRLASDPNPTYRPYAMSNQELTQRLLSLEQRVTALEG